MSETVVASDISNDLKDFEQQLARIRGVLSAATTRSPELGVTLVATRERGAKEIVRDVQSLAAAGFGFSIDHRSISIEWDDQQEKTAPEAKGTVARPLIAWINVSSEPRGGRVDVGLRWMGKETTGGSTFPLSTGRAARGLAAANAVANALKPRLIERGHKLVLETSQEIMIAGRLWMLVAGVYDDGSGGRPMLGSALVEDDSATAAARALLDGVNRSLTR